VKYSIGAQTYYVRIMNSTEYNPAPGFYRATSTDANAPASRNYIRFDNVKPDSNGDVVLTYSAITGADRATGVSGIQLVLQSRRRWRAARHYAGSAAKRRSRWWRTHLLGDRHRRLAHLPMAQKRSQYLRWRQHQRRENGQTHHQSFTVDDEAIYSVGGIQPAGSVTSKNATAYVSKYDITDAMAGYLEIRRDERFLAANVVSGGKPVTFDNPPAWTAGEVATR